MRIDTLPEDMVGLVVQPMPPHAGQFPNLEPIDGPVLPTLLDEYVRHEATCGDGCDEHKAWVARYLARHPHLAA